MAKRINVTLCVFYHNFKKKKKREGLIEWVEGLTFNFLRPRITGFSDGPMTEHILALPLYREHSGQGPLQRWGEVRNEKFTLALKTKQTKTLVTATAPSDTVAVREHAKTSAPRRTDCSGWPVATWFSAFQVKIWLLNQSNLKPSHPMIFLLLENVSCWDLQ